MTKKTDELRKHLKPGYVYRRADLMQWSNSVDRHISQLLKDGFLEKLSVGLYGVPRKTVFGSVPPDDENLVRTFLKDDDFLLTSPNTYNSLGVGTTQLYNVRIVYNHKRHGEFELGGRKFFFHAKHRFPKKATPEFLLVDLVNNLENLAEDKTLVLKNVFARASEMDSKSLKHAVLRYGSAKTIAVFSDLIQTNNKSADAISISPSIK